MHLQRRPLSQIGPYPLPRFKGPTLRTPNPAHILGHAPYLSGEIILQLGQEQQEHEKATDYGHCKAGARFGMACVPPLSLQQARESPGARAKRGDSSLPTTPPAPRPTRGAPAGLDPEVLQSLGVGIELLQLPQRLHGDRPERGH